MCVWDPGRDFAPRHMTYTPFVSSFPFVVAFPIQSSTFYFATYIFTFQFRDEFFSWSRERRVIGAWIDLRSQTLWLFSMKVSLATSYLSAAISCLTCFDALHASTSSDDFISTHIDVQV